MIIQDPTRGLFFEYRAGGSIAGATFSRASGATRRGRRGLGAAHVADQLRTHWAIDPVTGLTVPTTLLEGAATQILTQPDNLAHADWTARAGTPGLTAGQLDPFGGTGAYLLDDNDAATSEGIQINCGFTGDGVKAAAVFMRPNTAGVSTCLSITDDTAGQSRLGLVVDWSAGLPIITSISPGVLLAAEPWYLGFYRFLCQTTAVTAAQANKLILRIGADNAADIGSAYFYRPNLWNSLVASSAQGATLGVKATDSLVWPFPFPPQALFIYEEFIEAGSILTAAAATRNVGISDPTNERMGIYRSSTGYEGYHANAAFRSSQVTAPVPVVGDRVQHVLTVNAQGQPQLHQVINGGAETVATIGTAEPFNATFGLQLLAINSAVNGTAAGFNKFRVVKVGPLVFNGITRDTIAKAEAA